MPPKKRKDIEPKHQSGIVTTSDTSASPRAPDIDEFGPFDMEGHRLLAFFDDHTPPLKRALDALKEQESNTVTLKAMKETQARVIKELEQAVKQLGWVREALERATSVHAHMIKIEQVICNIEAEMKAVPTITAKMWAEVTATHTATATVANEHARKRQQRDTLLEEHSS